MQHLFVIRHAIAEERKDFQKTGQPDSLRPLTDEGRKKMHRISEHLHRLFPEIDVFVQSPLVRSQQTVAILKEYYSQSKVITSEDLDPDADFADLCESLQKLKKNNIAIVGHEEHLSHWTSYMMTGQKRGALLNYKKGGVALLEFDERIKEGEAHLAWLLTPRWILNKK